MYEFPKLELVIHNETMVKAIKTNPPDFLLSKKSLYKPVGCNYLREKRENLVKKNGLDIVQDTEIQYLDVAKQNNIYVKYSKKLFKSFRSYKFFEL